MQTTNSKRVFVAGAGGVIGRRLCRLLVADGHHVIGTTRKPTRVPELASQGVTPVVVDVFDAAALHSAVMTARPEVVIHQLTDLPPGLDPALMADARLRNARLREIGTRHLVSAARDAHAVRFIAQSLAFVYAPGPTPYTETAPLNLASADEAAAISAQAVASLERQVLHGPFIGIVLRYGRLYGPGTGFEQAHGPGPVHVDAAADAARRAIFCSQPGVYNIAEEDGTVTSAKARVTLDWDPEFRIGDSG